MVTILLNTQIVSAYPVILILLILVGNKWESVSVFIPMLSTYVHMMRDGMRHVYTLPSTHTPLIHTHVAIKLGFICKNAQKYLQISYYQLFIAIFYICECLMPCNSCKSYPWYKAGCTVADQPG